MNNGKVSHLLNTAGGVYILGKFENVMAKWNGLLTKGEGVGMTKKECRGRSIKEGEIKNQEKEIHEKLRFYP